jgi:hypothetical protein
VNDASNTLIFPQTQIQYLKKIPLFDDSLEINFVEGNQLFNKVYEGLTINNLYQQGHSFKLDWNKFSLNYFQLTDLRQGIGLNIDDSYDYIFGFEKNSAKNRKTKIQLGYSNYPKYVSVKNENREIVNFSIKISTLKKFSYYLQISYRPFNNNLFNFEQLFATLFGIQYTLNIKNFHGIFSIEGRYYGSGFNDDFRNINVSYRKTIINNSVGEFFYPLLLTERPFGQWNVYTEYQNQDISSIIFQFNLKYNFYEKIRLNIITDINYISSSNGDKFIYPFYNVGIEWFENSNSIKIGISNQGMNLDLYYPTYYLFENPKLMITLKRSLTKDWYK